MPYSEIVTTILKNNNAKKSIDKEGDKDKDLDNIIDFVLETIHSSDSQGCGYVNLRIKVVNVAHLVYLTRIAENEGSCFGFAKKDGTLAGRVFRNFLQGSSLLKQEHEAFTTPPQQMEVPKFLKFVDTWDKSLAFANNRSPSTKSYPNKLETQWASLWKNIPETIFPKGVYMFCALLNTNKLSTPMEILAQKQSSNVNKSKAMVFSEVWEKETESLGLEYNPVLRKTEKPSWSNLCLKMTYLGQRLKMDLQKMKIDLGH